MAYGATAGKTVRDTIDGPAHDRELKEQAVLAERSQRYLHGNGDDEPSSPDDLPEVRRELIMLVGALDSVWTRWYDLRRKLAPAVPHGQIEDEQDRPGRAAPSTTTDVGNGIRNIQDGLHRLEAELSFIEGRVQL